MSQTLFADMQNTHNVGVSSTAIEPGLLRLFRWFVAIRLGLLLFLLLAAQNPDPDDALFVPQAGVVILGFLLIYLYAIPLQNRLGRWYLPIALWVATLGPIIENVVNVNARLDAGASANEAIADYWLYFFYLFVPLIIIAWQYRYRWVVFFSVGTFLLDGAFTASQLEETGADAALLGALMLGRAVLFAFVGLIIVKLVGAQRSQSEAVAQSAITRERLAMSDERRRLARELHDTLAHTLSAVAVQLEGASSIWDDDPDRAKRMVDRSLESTRTGLTEARRSIVALRASPLEDLGLAAALKELCRSVTETSDVKVLLTANGPGPTDPDVQHTAYRVATEALTNVVRHANAATALVTMTGTDSNWHLTIEDDGTGIGVTTNNDGHGIIGMRERAQLIGASLEIQPRDDGGTIVELAKAP